ncbi:MAG TPA: hypothetical protein VIY48_14700 [Candidatus Paceibacterota bacterium]
MPRLSREAMMPFEDRRLPATVMIAAIGLVLTILVQIATVVWVASQYSAGIRALQAGQTVQSDINKQVSSVLSELTKTLAVIQSDHEKYVMPHVMGGKGH